MKIDIPVDSGSGTAAAPQDPNVETLLAALESERGLAVECADRNTAITLRMRLNRARKKFVTQTGNHQLMDLTLGVAFNRDAAAWEVLIQKKLAGTKIRAL